MPWDLFRQIAADLGTDVPMKRRTKGVGSLFTLSWRAYDYEELINRGKANLDIFWLRDESLEESDNLPDPRHSRPGKSSKTSKPPSSNFGKSQRIWIVRAGRPI